MDLGGMSIWPNAPPKLKFYMKNLKYSTILISKQLRVLLHNKHGNNWRSSEFVKFFLNVRFGLVNKI